MAGPAVPQAIFTKARLYYALFQQHSMPLSVHRHNGVSAVQRAEGGLLVGAKASKGCRRIQGTCNSVRAVARTCGSSGKPIQPTMNPMVPIPASRTALHSHFLLSLPLAGSRVAPLLHLSPWLGGDMTCIKFRRVRPEALPLSPRLTAPRFCPIPPKLSGEYGWIRVSLLSPSLIPFEFSNRASSLLP